LRDRPDLDRVFADLQYPRTNMSRTQLGGQDKIALVNGVVSMSTSRRVFAIQGDLPYHVTISQALLEGGKIGDSDSLRYADERPDLVLTGRRNPTDSLGVGGTGPGTVEASLGDSDVIG
jgi:hypothetical protein